MFEALAPMQIPTPGGLELAVILLIAVLLFGAQKIPELARSTGQAMGEFKRGRQELEEELEELEDEASLDEPVDTGSTTTTQTQGTSSTTGDSTSTSSQDEA